MKPILAALRRPVIVFMLAAALVIGGVLAASKMEAGSSYVDYLGKFKAYFQKHEEEVHDEQEIVVTTPKVEDVTITESFVCQIRSQRHIEVRALEGGYLSKILINEGQAVKKGDVMFEILPVLYKAKLDAANAKAELAKLKYQYTQQLVEKKVVSPNEALLAEGRTGRGAGQGESGGG